LASSISLATSFLAKTLATAAVIFLFGTHRFRRRRRRPTLLASLPSEGREGRRSSPRVRGR
jgi:hypothetical protein